MMKEKTLQRKICKERLASLTEGQRKEYSSLITDKLIHSESYATAKRIFIYRSLSEEVDTAAIIDNALKTGKEVYLPRIEGEDMFLIRYREQAPLQCNVYGIEEPVGASYEGDIDIAVIPLLGFDAARSRLGRGKGYYDRFLSRFAGRSIALAFSVQALPFVETEPFDKKPDLIITEEGEI